MTLRYNIGLIGIISTLGLGSSFHANAPRQNGTCEKEDRYVVVRNESTIDPTIGTGFVCEDSIQYYGWLAPTQDVTLPELMKNESNGQTIERKYQANLLAPAKDSVTQQYNIPVTISPDSLVSEFPYKLYGFIPARLHVNFKRTENNRGMLKAIVKEGFITLKTLRCPVDNLAFNCPK